MLDNTRQENRIDVILRYTKPLLSKSSHPLQILTHSNHNITPAVMTHIYHSSQQGGQPTRISKRVPSRVVNGKGCGEVVVSCLLPSTAVLRVYDWVL
jgi:hypothetical protein